MFRQDLKLLELVQSRPELVFVQTASDPPSHHLMQLFADLSRHFVLVRELLEVREVALPLVNLRPVARDQIDQSTEQKIAFGSEARLIVELSR